MMNYTSATSSSVHQMVSLIMVAKPLDFIIGQLTTKTMNKMVEQMAQMVAPVRPPHGEAAVDPLRLSSTMWIITPASPRRV
jgi:hypothetical protein